MWRVVAALLLASLPAWGQDSRAAVRADRGVVTTAQVLQPDGTRTNVEGGCWLSSSVCVATGRELVQLRRENTVLKVVLVGLGVVTAGVAGRALHTEVSTSR